MHNTNRRGFLQWMLTLPIVATMIAKASPQVAPAPLIQKTFEPTEQEWVDVGEVRDIKLNQFATMIDVTIRCDPDPWRKQISVVTPLKFFATIVNPHIVNPHIGFPILTGRKIRLQGFGTIKEILVRDITQCLSINCFNSGSEFRFEFTVTGDCCAEYPDPASRKTTSIRLLVQNLAVI